MKLMKEHEGGTSMTPFMLLHELHVYLLSVCFTLEMTGSDVSSGHPRTPRNPR